MTDWPILSTVTFLPLVGALLILLIRDDGASAHAQHPRHRAAGRRSSPSCSRCCIWIGFDNADPGFQLVEKADWLDSGITYHMGVDGISMLFVILTTFLMPLCILASWESIDKRVKEYMIAFLVLETLMIGVFCALDIVLFYVFFEGGLIPMFLIIGVWGGKRRVYAALQVLPLHAARLGADAARHHGDVLAGRHDRHPDAADASTSRPACRPGCGSPSSPPSR